VNKYNQNIPGYECLNSSAAAVQRVSLPDHPEEGTVLISLLKQSLWLLTPTICRAAIGTVPLVTMVLQSSERSPQITGKVQEDYCCSASSFCPQKSVVKATCAALSLQKTPFVSVYMSTGFEYFPSVL